VNRFLGQIRITERLLTSTAATIPPTIPATIPATIPEPEPIHLAEARRQLAKMRFDLPPHHPKRLVAYHCIDGYDLSKINPNFDPIAFASSARNTFVKTCCNSYSSVQECRCFNRRAKTSVTYINERGESIDVYYLRRKTDYQNLTKSYPHSYRPDEAIPRSPREDVSDSDMYPWRKDYDFENECGDAYCAKQQGFMHVWSSKEARKRHLRRQRRQQQLASGELPEHGLIVVTFDIDELSPVTTSAHHQHRQLRREKYEELQQYVRFYESWDEEHQRRPEPVAATPATPAPVSITKGLDHAQMRNLIWHKHINQNHHPEITNESLIISHGVSRLQVTEFSALSIHQRARITAFAAMTALLAIRLGAERGNTGYFPVCLHHRVIQLVIRRATRTEAVADKIAAPYIDDEKTHLLQGADPTRRDQLLREMKARFSGGIPVASRAQPEYRYGPIEFRRAKYYAQKCVELVGNHDDDHDPSTTTTTAAKWAHLRSQVQRVRRGEIDYLDVRTSADHNNWVYAIHYTYMIAVHDFLAGIERWRSTHHHRDQHHHHHQDQQQPEYWHNSKEIRVNASTKVQTTFMVREMYRFLIKTHKLISPGFISVFGLNRRYVHTMINRTKFLACYEGDEASALMFGFLVPSMMTPDVHLDIFVKGEAFQEPDLYVKMSDPVFGPIKKQLQDMIPSRHTGTIDRTRLMEEQNYPRRA
jgi:hypothetical protein